jgi:hypothetical protein
MHGAYGLRFTHKKWNYDLTNLNRDKIGIGIIGICNPTI